MALVDAIIPAALYWEDHVHALGVGEGHVLLVQAIPCPGGAQDGGIFLLLTPLQTWVVGPYANISEA